MSMDDENIPQESEQQPEAPRRGRPPKVNPNDLTVVHAKPGTALGQPKDFDSMIDMEDANFSGLRITQLPLGCYPDKWHYRYFPTEKARSGSNSTAHFSSEDQAIMALCKKTGAGEPVSPLNHPEIDQSMFVDGKYYDPQQENCLWCMSKTVIRGYYATNDQAVSKLKQMKAMRDPAPQLSGGALGFSEIGSQNQPTEGRRDPGMDGMKVRV